MIRLSNRPRNERNGFALVVVVWGLSILTLLAASYVMTARTATKVTANRLLGAKLQAAADGGAALAIYRIVTNRQRPALPGASKSDLSVPIACRFGPNIRVTVWVTDEAGRVDLNAASAPFLQAVLLGITKDSDLASELTDAIIDFRDQDSVRRPKGGEQEDYLNAGLQFGPKNYRFHSVAELDQVLKMPREVLEELSNVATVHLGRGGIDPVAATPTLRQYLDPSGVVPPAYIVRSTRSVLRINSLAMSKSGGEFARVAVVDVSGRSGKTYDVLSWSEGDKRAYRELQKTQKKFRSLPDC